MQVTLSPETIVLTPGGSPVVQEITITDVPADITVSQPIVVSLGATVVTVTTAVEVDNPSPSVSGAAVTPEYTVTYSTPVQDAVELSTWTCQATYAA